MSDTINLDDFETDDWIAVYKPGLLALVKERAQLQARVAELEAEIERLTRRV